MIYNEHNQEIAYFPLIYFYIGIPVCCDLMDFFSAQYFTHHIAVCNGVNVLCPPKGV